MNITNLLKYDHADGTVQQHVSVSEYSGLGGTRYRVSHSNSLSNEPFDVEPFDDRKAAMDRGALLRSRCIADLLSVLSDL